MISVNIFKPKCKRNPLSATLERVKNRAPTKVHLQEKTISLYESFSDQGHWPQLLGKIQGWRP